MIVEHGGKRPTIHESAYVAPNATLCGDVTVGENSRILFGATLVAEGGPVVIGAHTIVMENALVRGTSRHPARIGNHVLVGPAAHLTGCTVEDHAFLASGAMVFNGATIGKGSEIRINGVVHLSTRVPAGSVVPIGWVAVGNPAQILHSGEHDRIWGIQKPLDFPREVFGLERGPMDRMMTEMTTKYCRALGNHRNDEVIG